MGRYELNTKRQNFYCEHCKIYGQTMDKCWKVSDYPPNLKSNTLTKEEADSLKQMFFRLMSFPLWKKGVLTLSSHTSSL